LKGRCYKARPFGLGLRHATGDETLGLVGGDVDGLELLEALVGPDSTARTVGEEGGAVVL
jgi:hypothetical protein